MSQAECTVVAQTQGESHVKAAICPLVGHFGSPADPPLTFHRNVKELSWLLIEFWRQCVGDPGRFFFF